MTQIFELMPNLPDVSAVKNGSESGLIHFCEQTYVSPNAARAGSHALLKAFDDSGLWLASLVQPAQLVAELRQQCCLLTRVVVTQWTRQGETQKLVRLAEALMEAKPPVLSHEAGQIMALLASLLGILRPAQAPRWLEASRPLLMDSVDHFLLREATQWVSVGQWLSGLPQEDRLFWNRRLRAPDHDWDWDSAEALDALRRISPMLAEDHESLPLFQATLPRCWWYLWREFQLHTKPSVPDATVEALKGKFLPAFVLGLLTGIGCMILAGWLLPNFSFHQVALLAKFSPDQESKTKGVGLSVQMQARLAEANKIAMEMPELERLHSLVKTASLREAEPHVNGRTMIALQGSKAHEALLRWLMLDPPNNAEVRTLVRKVAVRALSSSVMFETLQLCIHEGSPNLEESREDASLLLALGGEGLSASQRDKLDKQVKGQGGKSE